MNELIPSEFRLAQNYPNPFSERTTIKLCVAYKTKITLEVFDPGGRLLRTLIDEEKEAGTYEIEFSAGRRSAFGEDAGTLSEGIYVYQLRAGDFSASKQMLLLKRKSSPLISHSPRDDVHSP
jgi:hypothetical protein